MIKTIKVKKQMRMDELIKYVWDNAIYPSHFECHAGFKIHFDSRAGIKVDNDYVHSDATVFTVEVEEEIEYDTVFGEVYRVTKEGKVTSDRHKSINDRLDWKDYQVQIFAMLDGKLELIWEDN